MSKTRDLETRLERAEQELRLFQRVSRLMTRDMELDGILQEIVSLVRAFLNCDSCLIYLKEEEELVLFASSDSDSKNIGRVRLRLNEGLTGWVARERLLLASPAKLTPTRVSNFSKTFRKTPSRRFSRSDHLAKPSRWRYQRAEPRAAHSFGWRYGNAEYARRAGGMSLSFVPAEK